MGEAFLDLLTGETKETGRFEGRIGFRFGGEGYFELSRADVEFTYSPERFSSWHLRLRPEAMALPEIEGWLERVGTSANELATLPAGEMMEIALAARPEVLASGNAALQAADSLAAMFEANGGALLNLDNYEIESRRYVSAFEEPAEWAEPAETAVVDSPPVVYE